MLTETVFVLWCGTIDVIKKIESSDFPPVTAGKQVRWGGFILNICGRGGSKFDVWNFSSERMAEIIRDHIGDLLQEARMQMENEAAEYYGAGLNTIALESIQTHAVRGRGPVRRRSSSSFSKRG